MNYKKFPSGSFNKSVWSSLTRSSSARCKNATQNSTFVYLKNKTISPSHATYYSSSSMAYFASKVTTDSNNNKRFYSAQAQATATKKAEPAMFCFQCQQTKDNTGCVVVGDCGKNDEVAAYQDLLIHQCKGLSLYSTEIRKIRKKLIAIMIIKIYLN